LGPYHQHQRCHHPQAWKIRDNGADIDGPKFQETLALLNLFTRTIENDRYPLSPRIQALRGILAKFGPMAPAPSPPARPPTPEERDPSRRLERGEASTIVACSPGA
jgi:hypothetical protein